MQDTKFFIRKNKITNKIVLNKILIISCVFPPEPVVSAQLSFDIATKLSEDNDITVISPKPTRPDSFKFENKIKKISFKHVVAKSFVFPKSQIYGRMRESYSFGKWCKKYIEEHHQNIDIIYQNSWPLFSQYFIAKVARKHQIHCITHVQDIYPDSFANKIPLLGFIIYRMLLPIDKYILRNSKKIICISDNMKNILQKTRDIKDEKFFIIQNWQNEENFINYIESKINTKSDADKPFTFMYLGNNGPVAGVEFLIESFVKAKVQNSKLIIAGSGSKTEDCKNLVHKLHAQNIEFMPVPEGKVPETQDLAEVLLLPVKTGAAMSSIPSKLPAYMFSQKPIIGSLDLESDTARAIIDADAGIVVEPENEEKLINAMREIAGWSKEKLAEKGKNGFNYSINHFSKRRNLRKITDIILDLTA